MAPPEKESSGRGRIPLSPPESSSQERGSTVTRVASVLGLLGIAAIVAALMFGGGGGYRITAAFQNAGQLVEGNQVQIGGRPIGSVDRIDLTPDGLASVEMEIDEDFAPLHQGTSAVIRASSLSGIANRYVQLSPGPNDAPAIPDGGRVGVDRTTAPVDLDQLFNTLDPATRRGLKRFIRGSATQYAGRGREANRSLGYLNPALSQSSRLLRELTFDQRAFERFIVDTSRLVTAVAERRTDLSALVGNANRTARAIGQENVALGRALGLLPGTMRRANTTFVNLRATLGDLDALVAESKPATRELAPFLRRLRPLVRDARPTIRDLSRLTRRAGEGNDLTDLTLQMPRLAGLASSVFPRGVRALRRSQPVIEYFRPYTPELTGWFTKFGQGAATFDANGHYARIQPLFNAFEIGRDDEGNEVLNPREDNDRLGDTERGRTQRCPGGATQPPPDGSAPFRDTDGRLDCDPGTRPPGP